MWETTMRRVERNENDYELVLVNTYELVLQNFATSDTNVTILSLILKSPLM